MAAVVSEPMVAALYTPSSQLKASTTSGAVSERRPPNRKAEIGRPFGSSQAGSSEGQFVAGTVKREFGCAALRPQPGVHSLPVQSVRRAGGVSVMPSHQTSPSGVSATLVKIVSRSIDFMQLGLLCTFVPGATPKYPASGLIA